MTFLQQTLANNKNKFVIIFLHHNVLSVGSDWLDKIKLKNSEQLLAIINKYSNVKAVVSGHVHQDSTTAHKNILFLTTPAISCQFAPKNVNFKLDTIMPGYRWLYLNPDGTIETEVARMPYDKNFIPSLECHGF